MWSDPPIFQIENQSKTCHASHKLGLGESEEELRTSDSLSLFFPHHTTRYTCKHLFTLELTWDYLRSNPYFRPMQRSSETRVQKDHYANFSVYSSSSKQHQQVNKKHVDFRESSSVIKTHYRYFYSFIDVDFRYRKFHPFKIHN